MQVLIDNVIRIRAKCQQYGKELETNLGPKLVPNDPRCGCFAMIFNKSTLTLELLNYYSQIWKQTFGGAKEAIEQARKENAERCVELTKLLFIGSMSSIEFSAKESIKLHPKSAVAQAIINLAATHRIYLSHVVRESSNKGLITKQEKDKWDHLIWVRNLMVHNNGIADTDDVYIIDAVTLNLEKGKMVQGKLGTFTNLVDSSVELYNSWIKSLEKQP